MNFRNDIQGLRAIAVLFIFIFHLSTTYLPGGFIGVDMFFVISGYLISKISFEKIKGGRFKLFDFYLARVKRIVPAYYFLLIAVWVSFLFIFASTETGKFKFSHFWTFLFNSNNYFAKTDDYFGAASTENPLLHTWTLSVEMQFYLILPLLLLLIRKVEALITVLSLTTAFLIGYSTYEILYGNRSGMYFGLLSRAPEFFIGVLAALTQIEQKIYIKKYASFLSIIGTLVLILTALLLHESSPFPGVTATIPCLATVALLISPSSSINKFLSRKIFAYIGEISYSIYLCHWPIMAFYRYHNERYAFTISETFVVIGLTIGASLFSYYLIERRLRRQKGARFYLPFAVLVLANVLMIYFVVPAKNRASNIPPEYGFPSFGRLSHGKDFQEVGVYGDANYSGKRILLLGDSHAMTFKPYLDTLGKRYNFAFRTITNDAYPAIPGISADEIAEPNRLKVYQELLPYIKQEVDSADILIVYFSKDGQRWAQAIEIMLASLRDDQRILFLSDYPHLDKDPVRANKGYLKNNGKKQNYRAEFIAIDQGIQDLLTSNRKARLVDYSNYRSFFKDAPFYNDTLMYYNEGHLNYYGSIKYAEFSGGEFMKALNWALNELQ